MIGAWALNQTMDDPDMAGEILTTWCQAAIFLLRAQFTEQTVLSRGYNPKVVGAFPRSLEDNHIRIDNVQHSISALLGLHNILAGFDGGDQKSTLDLTDNARLHSDQWRPCLR